MLLKYYLIINDPIIIGSSIVFKNEMILPESIEIHSTRHI
jgi:hypothetical protein